MIEKEVLLRILNNHLSIITKYKTENRKYSSDSYIMYYRGQEDILKDLIKEVENEF